MIASLSGKVIACAANHVVLEVNGVGYLVYIPTTLADRLKPHETLFLHTHLIVRQDALSLFGFETTESREFFELLLSVDGIGPKLALAVLSFMNPDSIRRAVFTEQADIFSRVPGVGKKTAQKILLYLQDKIKKTDGLAAMASASDVDTEVIAALTTLGYSVVEAQSAVQVIPKDAPQDVETRLRMALQYFSR